MSKRKVDRKYLTPELKSYYNHQNAAYGQVMRQNNLAAKTDAAGRDAWWQKSAARIDAQESLHVIRMLVPDFSQTDSRYKRCYVSGMSVAVAKGIHGFLKEPMVAVSQALVETGRDMEISALDSILARRLMRFGVVTDYPPEAGHLDFASNPARYFGIEHVVVDFVINMELPIIESMEWLRNAWERVTETFVFAAESLEAAQTKN